MLGNDDCLLAALSGLWEVGRRADLSKKVLRSGWRCTFRWASSRELVSMRDSIGRSATWRQRGVTVSPANLCSSPQYDHKTMGHIADLTMS